MEFILWIIAVVLVIAGIVSLVRGQMLWGIVLIIVGLLVGPGGVSIFDNDDDAAASLTTSTASASVDGPSSPMRRT
jgi:TM2 domain-containing membrane protein YozV